MGKADLIGIFYKLKIQIKGQENIPETGGIILLANKMNRITALAVEAALKRPIYWAVSPLACQSKLSRLFIKLFWRSFWLNPERPDIKGFYSAFGILKKSGVLAFYPAGINQGIVLFCLRSGCNILPMAVTEELTHPRRINIAFGPVYNLTEYREIIVNVKNIEEIIQRLNLSIEQL